MKAITDKLLIEKLTLTINEFCQYYSISRSTFYRLKKEDNLPPLRQIHRKYFLKKNEVDIWFDKIKKNNVSKIIPN